ncbi:hypothetical protein E4U54_006322 [Claviceps lovelessii]|nr:hypothetical protein E4U54_006322 [Claviceps lovelessii]
MNVGPPSGSHQPTLLPPRTPSELLQDILSYALNAPRPSTVIIGWPKEQFLAALAQDVRQQQHSPPPHQTRGQHPLLRNPSLAQIASARHVNMVFAPTVIHLRAYMATWTAPPQPAAEKRRHGPDEGAVRPPLLMVYGLLDLHKHDGTEWSAQGLGISTAMLVEGAWRSGFRAVMLEPRRRGRQKDDEGEGQGEGQGEGEGEVGMDELAALLSEKAPVLSGTRRPEDAHAPWTGPAVRVAHVLGDWFTLRRSLTL